MSGCLYIKQEKEQIIESTSLEEKYLSSNIWFNSICHNCQYNDAYL
jgi:hypothetical protein